MPRSAARQRRTIATVLATLAATALLVICLDYATMAATGGGFILGRSTSATTQTTRAPAGLRRAPAGRPQQEPPPDTVTTVHSFSLEVPDECGTHTRHRYLVQQEAWYAGTPTIIEVSLSVDEASHEFGPGTTVVQVTGSMGNGVSSRVVTLAPAHTGCASWSGLAPPFRPSIRPCVPWISATPAVSTRPAAPAPRPGVPSRAAESAQT